MLEKQQTSGANPFTLVRRLSWGLGDQVLSSFTNFLLGLLMAKALSPRHFGAFSLAYAVYSLALGACRALAGEPLVIRFSASEPDRWRAGVRGAVSTALLMGTLVGLGCLVAGLLLSGPLGTALLVLGPLLPALLVQDVWRFGFFAQARGARAFGNDLVWAVVLFSAVGVMRWLQLTSVGWLMISWAGAGTMAAAVGLAQTRIVPKGAGEARAWLKLHRDLAPRFLAEVGLSNIISSFSLFVMGGITGLQQVAAWRAGQVALGPLNVLFMGAGVVTVAEGVRILRKSSASLMRVSRTLSLLLAAAVVVWGVVVYSLPPGAGKLLLGANWAGARSVLVPMTIGTIGFALVFGPVTGLRSLAAAKRSLRARYIDVSFTTVLMLSGAAKNGAVGAAWGVAAAAAIRVPLWWWHFSRALRASHASDVHDPSADLVMS